MVKIIIEAIFLLNILDFLSSGDKVPICRLEFKQDPNAPNRLPLITIAPGIKTSNPGNASSCEIIILKNKPASIPPKY